MPKQTASPSHLVKRYNTYFAVLYVPQDVQYVLGKSKFSKSTQTDNFKLAKKIAEVYVMGWKAEIESARTKSDEPLIQSAKELRQLLKSSPRHLVQEVMEQEKQKLQDPKKVLHLQVFEQITSGKHYLVDLIKNWEKHEQKRGLATKSIDQMRSDLELITNQFPVAKLLTLESIELWIKHTAKKGKLTASSVTRIIGSGRNFFKYLQSIKEVSKTEINPFIVPDEFKISNKPNSKTLNKTQSYLPYSATEVVNLYQQALMDKDEKLANLILLGMHTGARIEELCSLLCKDINLIEESIAIRNAKTEAGERVIPIHSVIKDRIIQMIEKSTDDYLFTKLNKNKYGDRSNSLGKRFGRMKEKVGFTTRQYSFHSIRKTFTTLLENEGVGENITADIIGHEKPRITYGLYSGGSTLETMRKAIEKIRYKFS